MILVASMQNSSKIAPYTANISCIFRLHIHSNCSMQLIVRAYSFVGSFVSKQWVGGHNVKHSVSYACTVKLYTCGHVYRLVQSFSVGCQEERESEPTLGWS